MVIPWLGFPLGDLIKRLEPTGNARFVEFTTLLESRADAGSARSHLAVALRGGLAARRGDASVDAHGGWPVRPHAAQPERGAAASGRAVEVRLQGRQVDRQDQLHDAAATRIRGTSPVRASTASTRTSIQRSIIRAGVRQPNAASASSVAARRCHSTATPTRWPTCTRAWTCARTSDSMPTLTRRAAQTGQQHPDAWLKPGYSSAHWRHWRPSRCAR